MIAGQMTDIKEVMEAGLALLDKGKNLDALRELSKLEPEFEGKSTDEAADLYTAISQAYYGMNPKTDENSLPYSDKAFEIHKKNNSKEAMMNDLLYSAFVEMDCNKSAEAEKRLDSAIKIAEELKDNEAYVELLTTKADLLSGQKRRRKEAVDIYSQAAELAKKNGNMGTYFEASVGLLTMKREESDPSKVLEDAMKLIDEAEKFALTIKAKKDRKSFLEDVSAVYDLASDIAMEMENVDEAMQIAGRMSKILSK